MKKTNRVLIKRLNSKGMETGAIPGFIRNLANSILINPEMDLREVNRRLNYLGWHEFEIDYHTLQLAISCFEDNGLDTLKYKPAKWYERILMV